GRPRRESRRRRADAGPARVPARRVRAAEHAARGGGGGLRLGGRAHLAGSGRRRHRRGCRALALRAPRIFARGRRRGRPGGPPARPGVGGAGFHLPARARAPPSARRRRATRRHAAVGRERVKPLFVYGTLLDDAEVRRVTGRIFPRRPARLAGHRRAWPRDDYPHLVGDAAAVVEGDLLDGLDDTALAALDAYEDAPALY